MRLPPFRLERFFARHEFTARHLLCASDCESRSVGDLLALEPEAAAAFHDLRLGYVDPAGGPEVRAAIASQYDGIDPGEVLVHSGAQEAIFTFANAVLAPGDHVIVQTPCYQSLTDAARAAGCVVTEWPADERRGWALDLDFLADHVGERTRAIVVNWPHNPTGHLPPEDTFREIVAIARRREIFLFSDEVYRCLEHRPAARLPAACDVYENAISLGVTSKNLGLAGLRVGWVATHHRAAREAMAAVKDYTSICASGPGEFLAALALRHRDALLARNLDVIRANLARLDGFFARYAHCFEWRRPDAGPVAFPRVRLDVDVDALCDDLVARTGVLLLPGTVYEPGSRHVRFGFGRLDMPDALDALEGYLRERFPG